MAQQVNIIAEAGVNHNGSVELAKALVEIAVQSGANTVKFQAFSAEQLSTKSAQKADYQKKQGARDQNQYDMLKKLELRYEDFFELKALCERKKIGFLVSPFDEPSLDFLCDQLKLDTIKFGSGEITSLPLLLKAAQKNVRIILSTGMSDLHDIQWALATLCFGYAQMNGECQLQPSLEAFEVCYQDPHYQSILNKNVSLLHCTTEYPAPFESVNLHAMNTIKKKFGLSTGFSDHTPGIHIPVAAVALGATIIEKHFTLDQTMDGPDHQASLSPTELKAMIQRIREVEFALGSGIKEVQPVEQKNQEVARKSIVAKGAIKKGELFSENNLSIKRPNLGLSPKHYWSLLGQPSQQDYQPDDMILAGSL